MAIFEVITSIQAPRERSFDLARDLDLHKVSMAASKNRAVAGRTSGLIEAGEEVTWEARHFGMTHQHSARITEYRRPEHFRDVMVRGRFKRFERSLLRRGGGWHHYARCHRFESPFGAVGRVVDTFVLSRYRERLIVERNQVIKATAERPT